MGGQRHRGEARLSLRNCPRGRGPKTGVSDSAPTRVPEDRHFLAPGVLKKSAHLFWKKESSISGHMENLHLIKEVPPLPLKKKKKGFFIPLSNKNTQKCGIKYVLQMKTKSRPDHSHAARHSGHLSTQPLGRLRQVGLKFKVIVSNLMRTCLRTKIRRSRGAAFHPLDHRNRPPRWLVRKPRDDGLATHMKKRWAWTVTVGQHHGGSNATGRGT